MEDGKCLLDVINDPNALKDFLRSNSQISVEEESASRTDLNRKLHSISSSSSQVQPQRVANSHGNGVLVGSNVNHSSASIPQMSQQSSSTLAPQSLQNSKPTFKPVSNNFGFTSGTVMTAQANPSKPGILPNQSLSNLIQRTVSNPVDVVKTVGATIPSDAMQTNVVRPITTAAMPSGSKNAVPVNSLLTAMPAAAVATKPIQCSTGATKKIVTIKNNVASTSNLKTVSTNVGLLKSHLATPVAIQAKKPIPIQPKNPALIPQPVNIQAQNSSILKGLQYYTNTSQMKQPAATGQQIPFPSSTAQIVINGVNTAQTSSATTCRQPVRTQTVPQVLLSPSQKRIAPKQQPLLSQAVLSSPQQTLQQTLQQSQQRVLTPGQSSAHSLTQPVFVQQQSTAQSSLHQKHIVTQQNSSQPLQVQNSVQIKQSNPGVPAQQSQVQQIVNLVQEQQGSVLQGGSSIAQPTASIQVAQMQAEIFKKAQQLHQVQVTQQNMLKEQQHQKVMMSSTAQGATTLPTSEGTMQSTSTLQNVQSNTNLLIQQQFIKQFLEQKKQQLQTSTQLQKSNQDQLNQQQLLQQQQKLQQQQQQVQHQQKIQQQQQIKVSQKTALQPLQGLNVLQQQKLVQQIQQKLQQKAGQPPVSGAHQVLQQQEQQKGVTQISKAVSAQSTVQPNQVLVVTSQAAGSTKPVHLQQMMDQQQRQMQQILGQQQGTVSQQQKIIVANQPVMKTAVQTSQATSTQQTPKQQQSTAAANTLQKVFIIKQPQVLQKLGMQGIKPQQTVQITPQQLQVLKQFQQQQQILASNNKLPLSSGQTSSQQTTTVITQQQLKKLQLHLQQQQQQQQQSQGSVIKQALSQPQQQRQTLDQQLQPRTTQQQGNTKVLAKQLPRILQTSGRQPVNQSGVVTVPVPRSSAIGKQEVSKGIKRPHSEIADVPKAATKFKQVLGQDQQGVLHPVNKPFASHDEGIRKLARYHLYDDPDMSANDIEKSEALFSVVSNQLMRRSQKMMEKYRHLLYEESMRQEPSAEMVMLYRVFLADERAALANEKKLAKEANLSLNASTTLVTECPTSSSLNSSTVAKKMDTSKNPCSVLGQTTMAPAASSSANRSEVATAGLTVSATSKLSTETKTCPTSSSSAISSAPEQQVDFHSSVQTNHIATSSDTAINSSNAKSSENVSEEKDDETERTLEILDSILADLANQSS